MSRRQFMITLASVSALLLVLSSSVLLTSSVLAQCAEPPKSSCMTCHEKEAPVANNGEWHVVHASKDMCLNCHGGNGSTMDKDLAHDGMTMEPLADIYTDCHSCHPDYEARALRFAPTLGVTPGSCATPTPVAVGNFRVGPPPASLVMQSDLMNPSLGVPPFLILSGTITMLALFLAGLGWLARHPA